MAPITHKLRVRITKKGINEGNSEFSMLTHPSKEKSLKSRLILAVLNISPEAENSSGEGS